MNTNLQIFILLTLLTLAIGCSNYPPQEGKVTVKGALIGPPILIDDCVHLVDSPCVPYSVNDSSAYNFCFKVFNGDDSPIYLNNAEVRIPVPGSGGNDFEDNDCLLTFSPVTIKSDRSKTFSSSYCLSSAFTFRYGDSIQFYLVVDEQQGFTISMPICQE